MIYVDNWQIMSFSQEDLLHAATKSRAFCDIFRLQLDIKKSWCWAMNVDLAPLLEQEKLTRKDFADDLGASMRYTYKIPTSLYRQRLKLG